MNHPDASQKKKGEPSPTEVHPYEFAASRTLGLFLRLAKRVLIFLVTMAIIGIVLIILFSR